MAKQTVNLGTMADNKSGDPLRTAFEKINENFDELYASTGSGVGVNIGDQTTEPSQVSDIVFSGATVENIEGVSTVTITQPVIPEDIADLTDNTNLLGQGGVTYDQSLNTTDDVAFNTLTFPDGSIQTTAYTNNQPQPLYIVANTDGHIITSTDGLTFSDAIHTGMSNIGTVGIGPNRIVYTKLDVNADSDSPGLYSSTSPTIPPTLIEGTDGNGNYYFTQVKYFPTATPAWVAVGVSTETQPLIPIIMHSADGVTWSTTFVNGDYLGTFFTDDAYDLRFTDVQYGSGGWLICADRNSGGTTNGTKGGGLWWTTDITQELTDVNFISVDDNFKAVETFGASFFSKWTAFSWAGDWWNNNDQTPEVAGDWSEWTAAISDTIKNDTNLQDVSLEESTSGLSNLGSYMWAVSTADGHVVWWGNEPVGPYNTIPLPYTVTITSFAQSATSYIDPLTDGGIGFTQPGEKFTVTGSSVEGYNGTFYVDGSYFVFTDAQLTTPFDTSGLEPFTGTATLTWSHGQYIDALGFANGYLYCANDNEQVFRGEQTEFDTVIWTKVDDKNDSLMYWNTIGYYGAFRDSTNTGGGSGIDANIATTLGTVAYCPATNQAWINGDVSSVFTTGLHFFFSSSQTEFIVDSVQVDGNMTLITTTAEFGYWPQSGDTAFSILTTPVTAIQAGTGIDLSLNNSTLIVSKSATGADNNIIRINQVNGDWHGGVPDPQEYNMDDWNRPDLFVMAHNGATTNLQVNLPAAPVNGKVYTIKYAGRGANTQTCTVATSVGSIDNGDTTVVIDKDNGFVTLAWDSNWNTWWIIAKDII
jgi:hypothetical protein